MMARRGWGTASHLLGLMLDDDRKRARGVHLPDVDGNHGSGAVPIGWGDCAWDYEQSRGYIPVRMNPEYEYNAWWADDDIDWQRWPFPDHSWSYEEVGVYPFSYLDEEEDEWRGTAPLHRPDRRGYYDWEPPSWRLPDPDAKIKMSDFVVAERTEKLDDDYAEAWEEDLRIAEAEARKQADLEASMERARHLRENPEPSLYEAYLQEQAEHRAIVDEAREARRREKREKEEAKKDRQRLARMRGYLEDQIALHVRMGYEGEFEIEAREEGRTMRWRYEIKNGRAYITRKVQGWLPLAERPQS